MVQTQLGTNTVWSGSQQAQPVYGPAPTVFQPQPITPYAAQPLLPTGSDGDEYGTVVVETTQNSMAVSTANPTDPTGWQGTVVYTVTGDCIPSGSCASGPYEIPPVFGGLPENRSNFSTGQIRATGTINFSEPDTYFPEVGGTFQSNSQPTVDGTTIYRSVSLPDPSTQNFPTVARGITSAIGPRIASVPPLPRSVAEFRQFGSRSGIIDHGTPIFATTFAQEIDTSVRVFQSADTLDPNQIIAIRRGFFSNLLHGTDRRDITNRAAEIAHQRFGNDVGSQTGFPLAVSYSRFREKNESSPNYELADQVLSRLAIIAAEGEGDINFAARDLLFVLLSQDGDILRQRRTYDPRTGGGLPPVLPLPVDEEDEDASVPIEIDWKTPSDPTDLEMSLVRTASLDQKSRLQRGHLVLGTQILVRGAAVGGALFANLPSWQDDVGGSLKTYLTHCEKLRMRGAIAAFACSGKIGVHELDLMLVFANGNAILTFEKPKY